MQKWEYLLVSMDIGVGSDLDQGKVADRLKRLGQEGWELVGTVQDSIGRFAKFIFKRPLN